MDLEVTTAGALTAREPWSDEARAARRARDPFPPTPPDLLSRAQRSDPVAVSALFRTYWEAIRSFLRSQGAREDEAPDVAQLALLSVWQRKDLERFRPERSGSFRAWLRTVAKNHLLRLRRTQARQSRREAGSAQLELERQLAGAHQHCADQAVRRGRALETVNRVWERVAKRYREAGEQAVFEYLHESLYSGVVERDEQLSRELGHSDGYLAKRRHDLQHRDYAKALLAEYRQLSLLRSRQGLQALPSFREWKQGLLDDLG